MRLWLDGGFWGPWIRRVFIPEIKWMKRSVFEYILPSFPDAGLEAEKAADEAWQAIMSQPSDGMDDPGDYAELADEKGIETYTGITNMRQAAVNLSAAMLWHLLEQQMLLFHARQVLRIDEETQVRHEAKTRRQLFTLKEFHQRLEDGGCSIRSLPSWAKVDELRLVANAIKHGPGESLDDLCRIRPDLLVMPESHVYISPSGELPAWIEKPAGGEDLYVRDTDLAAYFDAAISLWQEFSRQIEQHK